MHGPTNPLSLPALRAVIAGVHQKSLKLDGYGFECEGGPLTHCRDWTELRTDLTTLADACERLAEENERMRGADRTGLMTAGTGLFSVEECDARLDALIATTRRAALIEAAEMCEGEARAWDVVGLLDYARPLTAMAARLRALADQPTPPASREGASNA